MLHTRTQGHWPFGSGEEGFLRGFTIYGRGSYLGHVTRMPRINFRSPDPWRLHMKFDFHWPSGFGEEDLWKWWTDDYVQMTEHAYTRRAKLSNRPLTFCRFSSKPKWLRLALRFWRRRSLKMVDGQWTDDGACLYYKLTNEPKGSGELKMGWKSLVQQPVCLPVIRCKKTEQNLHVAILYQKTYTVPMRRHVGGSLLHCELFRQTSPAWPTSLYPGRQLKTAVSPGLIPVISIWPFAGLPRVSQSVY